MALVTALQIVVVIQNLLLLFFLLSSSAAEDMKRKLLSAGAALVLTQIAIEFFFSPDAYSFWARLSWAMTFVHGPIAYFLVMDWDGSPLSLERAVPHLLPALAVFLVYDPAHTTFLKVSLSVCTLGYVWGGLRKLREAKAASERVPEDQPSFPTLLPLLFWIIGLFALTNLYVAMVENQAYQALSPGVGYVWFFGIAQILLPTSGLIILFCLTCTSVLFIAMALNQPDIFHDGNPLSRRGNEKALREERQENQVKASGSYRHALDETERQYLHDLALKVRTYVEQDELFCDPNLTISRLARKLKTSDRDVSRAINLVFNQKFPELINELRITKATSLLVNTETRHLSIIDVQLQCGFNSKSNFYRAFNQVMGLTPSQYRAEALSAS